jgi:hypothetical protein
MADAESLERLIRTIEERDVRLVARQERSEQRQERSEQMFIAAMSDIDASIQRNTERLGDMADAIADIRGSVQANTRAILSVLDRLEPTQG